ncbi:hypothetical protein BDZ94DRAFT_1323253 [Collybia nuda]|uniref:Uncharacterized protein n=1 Tax=Collybia nuda TaxID=64659 RepID=A0A9P5Y3F8_9AGAR|nr:hypothetical protein BDZ94DRAFT_1323253 [Collybia nuda]
MKPVISLAFISLPAIIIAHAETITFFKIHETEITTGVPLPTGSYTYRPVGVGSDGATTYVQEFVYSEHLEWFHSQYTSEGKVITVDSPTSTVTDSPRTTSQILVADATHYAYSAHLGFEGKGEEDVLENCDLDGKGGMGCVATAYKSGKPFFSTSFTGHAIPAYTLITVDDKADNGTKNNVATKTGLPHLVASITVITGILFGLFIGI